MTTSLYIQCVAMFILGQMLQLFLLKLPAFKARCKAANKEFSMKAWWAEDWMLVIGTQVVGALAILGLDELTKWKPEIVNVVKWFFAGVGAFGSSIVMSKMSQFEKGIMKTIDFKTDIADGKTPETK